MYAWAHHQPHQYSLTPVTCKAFDTVSKGETTETCIAGSRNSCNACFQHPTKAATATGQQQRSQDKRIGREPRSHSSNNFKISGSDPGRQPVNNREVDTWGHTVAKGGQLSGVMLPCKKLRWQLDARAMKPCNQLYSCCGVIPQHF